MQSYLASLCFVVETPIPLVLATPKVIRKRPCGWHVVLCLLQVGLLVATLQLDVSLLIQAFDLGFCDAFMPSEVYEECEAAAKHAAAEKVR